MLDASKTLKAKDIVENPDEVLGIMQSHILVSDFSMSGQNYSSMIEAMNILYDMGWEVVTTTITPANNNMLVCFKNMLYKRKNG